MYSYYEFKDKDDHLLKAYSAKKLYALSQDHFDTARLSFEKYPECQTVIKKKPYLILDNYKNSIIFF